MGTGCTEALAGGSPWKLLAHPAAGIADFTPIFCTLAKRDRTSGLLEAASRCTVAAALV